MSSVQRWARAERFVRDEPAIEHKIGRVTNVRLAFRDYSLGSADDTAHLELVVAGERGIGYASVDLEWERGAWDVTSVLFRREGETVPVRTFPLEKPRRRGMWVASFPRSRAPLPRTT